MKFYSNLVNIKEIAKEKTEKPHMELTYSFECF